MSAAEAVSTSSHERLTRAWHSLLESATAPAAVSEIGEFLRRDATGAWVAERALDNEISDLLELYLPICNKPAGRTHIVGHLGQSLDGFIATGSGDSDYVTGQENIVHLHRMRALSCAVIVGAGTVAADDPELTTRLAPGPDPVRVVLDPNGRLDQRRRLFSDGRSPVLHVLNAASANEGQVSPGVEVLAVTCSEGRFDLTELVAKLAGRGLTKLFVEGGGHCVSSFLEAGLLDRLQIAIAPLLIGKGRPGIVIEGSERLIDCLRPRSRLFVMGGDALFDCLLRED
jgi:diaminohydroxyphosphoribosylaminopyrimidine deaminase/5-amino-6-(5-phosphoribosylamino)uracil reductase